MGIAKELKRVGLSEADVHLAAGLPLTWVKAQREEFTNYLMRNERVEFEFNDRLYKVHFVGCSVFPQGYTAVIDKSCNTILLRKEDKRIRPTNYNFSFYSSNTLGRNYIGPSNRADMCQILIFGTNFLHCSLNATAKSGIINNRQREIRCRQLIWSEANEYTKEKAITYRKGSRDHC